ncbi:hypothetical protein [uncultured Sphingosinicella sp.]|uniref:hypothetical protein n=1 Tax=uncultured Sphingosinicella sp. TaxID=478748 RepID=UPI0030D8C45B
MGQIAGLTTDYARKLEDLRRAWLPLERNFGLVPRPRQIALLESRNREIHVFGYAHISTI